MLKRLRDNLRQWTSGLYHRRSESPANRSINAVGGGGSLERTRLRAEFLGNRESFREFDAVRAFYDRSGATKTITIPTLLTGPVSFSIGSSSESSESYQGRCQARSGNRRSGSLLRSCFVRASLIDCVTEGERNTADCLGNGAPTDVGGGFTSELGADHQGFSLLVIRATSTINAGASAPPCVIAFHRPPSCTLGSGSTILFRARSRCIRASGDRSVAGNRTAGVAPPIWNRRPRLRSAL